MNGTDDPMISMFSYQPVVDPNQQPIAFQSEGADLTTTDRFQITNSGRISDSSPTTYVHSSGSSFSSNTAGFGLSPDAYGEINDELFSAARDFIINDVMSGQNYADSHVPAIHQGFDSPYTPNPPAVDHGNVYQNDFLHASNQMGLTPLPSIDSIMPNSTQETNALQNSGSECAHTHNVDYLKQRRAEQSEGPSRKKTRRDNTTVTGDVVFAPTIITLPHNQPPSRNTHSTHTTSSSSENECVHNLTNREAHPTITYPSSPPIRFHPYCQDKCHTLYDSYHQEIHPQMRVIDHKGFEYSSEFSSFINYKKNNFQITCDIELFHDNPPAFVLVNNEMKPIFEYRLELRGVKAELESSPIEIKQSDDDRKFVPYQPVVLETIPPHQSVTICRLHFAKATGDNQKHPHPKQKYFILVVSLMAVTADGIGHSVLSLASDCIIVRAGNPKEFESPIGVDAQWHSSNGLMSTKNPVSIGSDQHRGGILDVNGDILCTGVVRYVCDGRFKYRIVPLDRRDARRRLNMVEIVEFYYKEEVARAMGMNEQARHRVGVIAQKLRKIYPQSVHDEGGFLTIDENRLIYESIAALQDLSQLHDELEDNIVERVNYILTHLGKIFRLKDSMEDAIEGGLAKQKTLFKSDNSLADSFKRKITEQAISGTSRLVQWTLVTMVFVMAACLVSMSVIYFIHIRNRPCEINEAVRKAEADEESLGMMKKTIVVPRHQPGAPPLHGMCLHGGCRSYCCGKRSLYADESRHGGFDLHSPLLPLVGGSRRAFLSAVAGAEPIAPTAFFPKPLRSGTRIEVEGVQMTIDARYCTERSCDEKRGRFHLFVPVSPYMNTAPVRLRFVAPPGMFVQSCGRLVDFQEEECHPEHVYPVFTLDMPIASEVEHTVFEVSAGSFKRSAYRFRVGTNTESCYATDHDSSFEEYNIIFYRTCDDNDEEIQMGIDEDSVLAIEQDLHTTSNT